MRFRYVDYAGKSGPYTAEEAVARQIDKETALCDGQLERLEAKVESLQGMLGRLIEFTPVRGTHDREELARVLGCCWEPEEE